MRGGDRGVADLLDWSFGVGGAIFKFALLTLIAALPIGAAYCRAQDPRLGTWTLVSAQSSLEPPDKLSITDVQNAVHVVMSGESRLDFAAKADGHEAAVPGNPGFDSIQIRRMGRKQVAVTEKKDGAVVATLQSKLSNDGRELTIVTASPGHADQTTVWTRGGGAKAGKDPLAGEWTEDLSKTRLRQGLVLKIEPDGKDGVRFSGDSSYTARLDGKPYDVRNGRNDTVALALVDAHTLDAIYRRDGQVTQKDRWVVSADGRQMTLTSMGTLETGQKMSEKLGFQRQ